MNNFNWKNWFIGSLVAGSTAGCGAVSTGFVLVWNDPAHFSATAPWLIIKALSAMFFFVAIPTFFAFLYKNAPPLVTTTTNVTTTAAAASASAVPNPFDAYVKRTTSTTTTTKESS